MLFWKVFQRLEDSVGAWVDGDRRAVAPPDHALLVDHEQRALATPVGLAVGSVATGDWETFVTSELVSYVDSHYRTLARPESRGLNYNLDHPQPNPEWAQRDTILRK